MQTAILTSISFVLLLGSAARLGFALNDTDGPPMMALAVFILSGAMFAIINGWINL